MSILSDRRQSEHSTAAIRAKTLYSIDWRNIYSFVACAECGSILLNDEA